MYWSWPDVVKQLEQQLKLTEQPESVWAFQYFDDEEDMIFVSNKDWVKA